MRLGIYIRPCQTGTRYAGIGRYVSDLTKCLCHRDDIEICLIYDKELPHAHLTDAIDASESFTTLGLRFGVYPPGSIAQSLIGEAIVATGIDWLLLPHLFDDYAGWLIDAMRPLGCVQLALIHYDLVPLIFSDQYLRSQRYAHFYRESLNYLNEFDCIASISEFSKVDLDRHFPDLNVRSIAIGTGVDQTRFQIKSGTGKFATNIPERMLLCAPSGFDYRKNVAGLLRVYSLLSETTRETYPLYVVGRVGERDYAKLHRVCEDLEIIHQVKFCGFVDDDVLIELYQNAACFVFPSIYEGFGLPALEAVLCGCPTLAVNRSSLPEVLGEGNGLVDPDDHESWARAIELVLNDQDERLALWERQYEHAKTITWDVVSDQLVSALEPVAIETKRSPIIDLKEHFDSTIDSLQPMNLDVVESKQLTLTIADLEKQLRLIQARSIARQAGRLSWRLEGHWAGDYSLAQLNRESALALIDGGETVSIAEHDGTSYQSLDQTALVTWPRLQALSEISDQTVKVYSRNQYPPKVTDFPADGLHVMHHYAWEETGFPIGWAFDFNHALDGMSCLSSHVMKTLIDHGVDIPLTVSGCGVRQTEKTAPQKQKNTERVVFLHVSSCFPRKGVDSLLQAYVKAFTADDPVLLKIKTFNNPHNDVPEQIEKLTKSVPNHPAIEVNFASLSDAEMSELYQSADVLVTPSRAEGFGLPIFEAALHGVPSIVTGWGGHMDLCSDENAWLLDFSFTQATSHLPVYDSAWAEPSIDHLVKLFKVAYAEPSVLRAERANRLVERIRAYCSWADVMQRHRQLIESLQTHSFCRPRVGWVTTFGERCGIATTTEMLIREMDAPAPVIFSRKDVGVPVEMDHRDVRSITVFPSWDEFGFYGVLDAVETYRLQVVVVQFVYPFYSYEALIELIDRLDQKGCVVVVELHESEPPRYSSERHLSALAQSLLKCDRVLVHSVNALNDLKAIGLVNNVSLFPLGVRMPSGQLASTAGNEEWKARIHSARQDNNLVIASYGFFLPHKGLSELIAVAHRMRHLGQQVHLLLLNAEYPSPISRQAIAVATKKIRELGVEEHVTVVTEFLDDELALDGLSLADLLVFPYRTTEQGASGAVRFGLAVDRPVITSDLPIFDEFGDLVTRFDSDSVTDMADQLTDFAMRARINDDLLLKQLERVRQWTATHNYGVLAKRYYGMLTGLVRQRLKGSG